MLEIREKFTADGYEELFGSKVSDSFHITEAVDKDEVIGFIAYSYETDKTIVYDYDDGGDPYALRWTCPLGYIQKLY